PVCNRLCSRLRQHTAFGFCADLPPEKLQMSASQAQAQTQTAQPESSQTVLHSSNRLMIAVVLALTFAAYIGTIRYQFVYDDRNQIVENSFIKSWQNVPGYFTGQVWQSIYP